MTNLPNIKNHLLPLLLLCIPRLMKAPSLAVFMGTIFEESFGNVLLRHPALVLRVEPRAGQCECHDCTQHRSPLCPRHSSTRPCSCLNPQRTTVTDITCFYLIPMQLSLLKQWFLFSPQNRGNKVTAAIYLTLRDAHGLLYQSQFPCSILPLKD